MFDPNCPTNQQLNGELNYLDMLKHVLHLGVRKENRTGVAAFTCASLSLTHDMSLGFPLLTTKKMGIKTILTELEGFIHGITDKQWYKDRKCNIWNEWCNPEMIPAELAGDKKAREAFMLECNDLGSCYGYQWRNFNRPYENGKPNSARNYGFSSNDGEAAAKRIAMEHGDQFDAILHTLRFNPDDRRMVVSAWNPQQLDQMALPACHMGYTIIHINGTLHLNWNQRSNDLYLGVPYNLASYAALLLLICKETGMKPGTVTGNLCDVHIYENHIDQVNEQLLRTPRPLPRLEFTNWEGIYNWKAREDSELIDYSSHEALKAPVAI